MLLDIGSKSGSGWILDTPLMMFLYRIRLKMDQKGHIINQKGLKMMFLYRIRLKMDEKGHKIDQKRLKMYEKGEKMSFFGPKIPAF